MVWQQVVCSITPVVELAEAERDLIVVIPFHVQFFDQLIVNVMPELNVCCSGSAAFVLVCRNVMSGILNGAETIPSDYFACSFSLDDFDALVICTWTCD